MKLLSLVKTCHRCKKDKPVGDFRKNQHWCAGCRADANKLWYLNGGKEQQRQRRFLRRREDPIFKLKCQKEKQKWAKQNPRKIKNKNLQWLYDITLEQYEELLKKQNGRCAICQTDTPGRKKKYFCVDHNHENGWIRGLLCHTCNLFVGYIQDSPDLCLVVANYLWESQLADAVER